MSYTYYMQFKMMKILREGLSSFVFAILLLAVSPSIASAQAYVPVFDVELNPAFNTFAQQMNDALTIAPDSLRDIISGGNPQGVAVQECVVKENPTPVVMYVDGPWSVAVASSTPPGGGEPTLPALPPTPVINNSASLRCLLQEVVEWQKLGLSLQIHQLLKQYIADAQAAQLNNQLMNKIAAANLNWAKGGNEVDNNGIISNEPVYVTNGSQSIYDVKDRQLSNITDQAAADPASGNPVGSLGICEPWRLDVTAEMVENNRTGTEDPMNYTTPATTCGIDDVLDQNDWGSFQGAYDTPANKESGFATFGDILRNHSDSPLRASTRLTNIASSRLERQEKSTEREYANTGSRPTKECSGRPDDPYCLDEQNSTSNTPGYQNANNIGEVAQQGNTQVQESNTLDGTGGVTAQGQSTELNTNRGGLDGYDPSGLATSKTSVNRLVQEFWDTIQFGYFGVTPDTIEWAQATMAMIYDEMKFNDGSTEVIVTNDTTPAPTGYGI